MFFLSNAPNDVVFYFPRTKRELWANSAALKAVSPYFATLFDSGFKESSSSTVGEGIITDSAEIDELAQDSDDESDRVPFKLATTRTKSALPLGVKEVVIRSAAYTTYLAVLTYIHSGFNNFAPLSIPSLFVKNPGPARTAALTASATNHPNLPLPASPKSVFKLAHLLELEDLAKLALVDYQSKLTVDNVLHELVTDMSVYDCAREALVAFAVPNWTAVRQTAVAKELTKADVVDGLPNVSAAVAVLFELALKAEKLAG